MFHSLRSNLPLQNISQIADRKGGGDTFVEPDLLPHVVPMLVLDVLRHVLQDQPVHLVAGGPLWSTLQTSWDLSYDPPKKWATQFFGTLQLVVLRGQRALGEALRSFIEKIGIGKRTRGNTQGQIACPPSSYSLSEDDTYDVLSG